MSNIGPKLVTDPPMPGMGMGVDEVLETSTPIKKSGVETPPKAGAISSFSQSTAGWQPQLPKPNISMANMGLLLMSVQDKMSAQRLKTGEETIKTGQKKMQDIHQERAQKLKEYFDKLAQSAPKSKGFFGRLVSAFTGFWGGIGKAISGVFKGDKPEDIKKNLDNSIKDALDNLGKAFSENIGSVINIAVWGGLALITMNPAFLIGILPTILEEPELQEIVAKVFNTDKETIGKWVFGINIAMNVTISVVVGVVAGIGTGALITAATGGTGVGVGIVAGIAAGVAVGVGLAVVMGAAPLATGIVEAQRTGLQAEAHKDGAEADKLKALYTNMQEEMKREMDYIKSSMESMSANTEATMKLFRSEQQALHSSTAV